MATKTITGQVQIRNDTAQNWAVENPVLLPGELGLETDTGNGKFGDGETTWNSLKYAFRRNNTRSIEYIVGTQTATTGAWTGVSEDTSLYDGKLILYFLPCAGSGSATLNLTLADGTQTGAIPVYIGASGVNGTRMTTHFAVKTQGAPMLLAYDAKNNVWCNMQYWSDSNTYDRTLLNDVRVTAGTNGIFNYGLVMQRPDGTWESLTTSGGTGGTKAKNTHGFLFDKVWRYSYSNNITSGNLTTNDYLYDCTQLDLRYSTNCNQTLTVNKPVYLVGTVNNDGLFYLDTPWWTQTLPDTEDGKVYIYLGDTYNAYSIYFVSKNPALYYKDGAIREYSYIPNDYVKGSDLSAVATSGSYADLSNKPTIPEAYTLPKASANTLGGIKVGSNLSIDSNGVLNAKVPALVSACTTGDYHAASTVISLTVSLADYNKLHFVCGADSATEGVQTVTVPLHTGKTYHRLTWFSGDGKHRFDGEAHKYLVISINETANTVTIVTSGVASNGISQILAS
ncbi:MAG: hypothetical protein IJ858_06025 [Acidaminococcaceae bacterium]|nr:hypothetical protein [Acidaminococcaceae bacterium]